jgi:hypothetical protein
MLIKSIHLFLFLIVPLNFPFLFNLEALLLPLHELFVLLVLFLDSREDKTSPVALYAVNSVTDNNQIPGLQPQERPLFRIQLGVFAMHALDETKRKY